MSKSSKLSTSTLIVLLCNGRIVIEWQNCSENNIMKSKAKRIQEVDVDFKGISTFSPTIHWSLQWALQTLHLSLRKLFSSWYVEQCLQQLICTKVYKSVKRVIKTITHIGTSYDNMMVLSQSTSDPTQNCKRKQKHENKLDRRLSQIMLAFS